MAARLGVGRSTNRSGEAIRRRVQKSGWSRTGQIPGRESLDQPMHPGHVVEVPMTEHDRLKGVR